MKKYILEIHTEELRGRMSASRYVKCYSLYEAEEARANEYESFASKHLFLVDIELSDGTWLIEYQNKMRTTFRIKCA